MSQPSGWSPPEPPDEATGPPGTPSRAGPDDDKGPSPTAAPTVWEQPWGPQPPSAPSPPWAPAAPPRWSTQAPPQEPTGYGPTGYGPTGYGPTGYGPTGPPWYGPAGSGSVPGWSSAPAAWRKPGIVPLRPLSLSEILDGAFQAIRSNPRTMLGISAIVLAIASLIAVVPQAAIQQMVGAGLARAEQSGDPTLLIQPELSSLLATLPGTALVALATTVLNAMLVVAVSSAVLGRKIAPGQLWRRVRGRVPAAIGLSLLSGSIALLAAALPLLPAVLAFVAGQAVLGVVLLLLGVVGTVVASALVVVRFSLAAPALLLEQQSVVASLRRSWRLVRGSFWRTLGIELLASLLAYIGTLLITGPTALIGALVQAAIGNTSGASFSGDLFGAVVVATGRTASGAVFTPWISAVIALVYVDLRMRREGLDLELIKAADAGTDS
jgi:hypothetical protein